MSEVWSRVVVGGLSGSLMRSSSRLAATRPISRQGWATTVSRGSKLSAQSKSSNPTSATSRGTATPQRRRPRITPMVARLLPARMAVGGCATRIRPSAEVRGGVDVDRAGRDQIILGVDAVPGDRRTVARNAFEGCGEARLARHHSDPPMPQTDEMVDEPLDEVRVVHADLIEFLGYKTIDEHGRYLVFPDIADGAFVRRGRRREDDAVDAVLMQCLHDLQLPLRNVVGVGKEDCHAERCAFGFDGPDNVAEIGIRDGRDGDANAVG